MSDVILYKEDIDRLNSILHALVSETRIFSALLINKDTRLLAHQGALAMFDMSALAALIVGSFASTQAIAGLVGEHEFSTMVHYGKLKNLLISLVDDNTIMATVFDRSIPISSVSASINRHMETLRKALAAIASNMETFFQGPVAMPSLSQDDVDQGFDSFFDQPAVAAIPPQGAPAVPSQSAMAASESPWSPERGTGPRDTQRVIPPPETKHFEYTPIPGPPPATRQFQPGPNRDEPEKGPITNASIAAMKKIPPPGNTEYLHFISINYLKNKAKEGSSFKKQRPEKGILSRIFNRSRSNF
jgi:hypothetical protein